MISSEELEAEESIVRQIRADLASVDSLIATEKVALSKAARRLERTLEAQEILQRIAQAVQQKAHEKISEVVSSCLEAVFDDPYSFEIVFERKRGKTEAKLRFTRRGLSVDPLTAAGGGMVDVAAFALRAACLMLHRPRLNRLLVLDEPFRFVSVQYQENIRYMIEKLSKEMGIQIVLVTHVDELAIGKIIEL